MNSDDGMSPEKIDALLQFLPVFESDGFVFGDWSKPGTNDPGTASFPVFLLSREANAFHQMLIDDGWITSFDWTEWTREGERYVESPQALQDADMNTIQKLLTMHARQDRFCDGHLAAMFECGHLTAILRRIKQIAGGK